MKSWEKRPPLTGAWLNLHITDIDMDIATIELSDIREEFLSLPNDRMGSKHIPNIAGHRKWHSFPSGGSDLRVVFKKILSHCVIIDLKRDCLLIYDFWYQSNVCMNLWDLGYCNWMMCSHHCFPLPHINYLNMLLESGCTSCTPLCRGLVQGASVWISGELHEILKYTQACLKLQSWFYHPFGPLGLFTV